MKDEQSGGEPAPRDQRLEAVGLDGRDHSAAEGTYLEGKTNAEKAGCYLEEAGDHGSWQLLRARAGLAAENEKWSEAIELLEECILAAPPRLEAELRVQQASYRDEEPWRIVVPKKGAAKPARRP